MARKILLADDSVTAQNMGRKILTDAGYEVITVNNGSAALKRIAEQKPDLIVLDVYMPGYSGLEVCQRIKENRDTARIPVLLTVGKLEPFKPEEARRARADAFVVKPFEASELLATLTRLEDKIVPQAEPYKPGRFAKAFAAVEQVDAGERFGDVDGGWKDRLRFPSRRSKTPEPEPVPEIVSGKGSQDLVAPPSPPSQSQAVGREQEFERVMPAGIPHDITPEEIAAITAAAAKMSGNVEELIPPPVIEAPLPPVLETLPNIEQTPPPTEEPRARTDAVVADIPVDFRPRPAEPLVEPPEPVTFAAALSTEVSDAIPAAASSDAPAIEVPNEPLPAVLQSVGEVAPAVPLEPIEATAIGPEVPSLESAAVYPKSEILNIEQAPPPEPDAGLPTLPESDDASESALEPAAKAVTEAAPLASEAYFGPKLPVHSDAEVMAALQALVPSDRHGPATIAPEVLNQSLDPAASVNLRVSNDELTRVELHTGRPRWIAEEVSLSAEEATLSLEKEMEKAYAAFAAFDSTRTLAALDLQSVRQPVNVPQETMDVSPVVNTPQSFEQPPSISPEAAPELVAEPAIEATVLAMASAAAAGDLGSLTKSVAMEVPREKTVLAAQERKPDFISPAVECSSPSSASDEQSGASPLDEATLAAATLDTEIAGGIDEMGKKDWADFRSVRGAAAAPKPAPVAPLDSPVIPEDSAKTKPQQPIAPVVPAERALSPTDPKAIASIVDSVLAELRPKIVEEIARKLSDPKKD